MAELCQKLLVVFEIDTEKNRDAEHKLPVGYWIENIVTYILSELDHLFGMAAWAEKSLIGPTRPASSVPVECLVRRFCQLIILWPIENSSVPFFESFFGGQIESSR